MDGIGLMTKKKRRPVIFGELLFDQFADGTRVIGGAPFNVAWHLQALGQAPLLISAVGQDAAGAEALASMQAWHLSTEAISINAHLPTGEVRVELVDNEPQYDIAHPCAYDAITLETLPSGALLYHGSLALREAESRAALQQLKTASWQKIVVDVNLRPPWWHIDSLLESLQQADWVKMNQQEYEQIRAALAVASVPDCVRALQVQGVILTHGASGAEVFTAAGEHLTVAPESHIEVVDTVGAGDAFAAVMLTGMLQDWPLSTQLHRAQEFATAVVGLRGATTQDPTFYAPFVAAWSL